MTNTPHDPATGSGDSGTVPAQPVVQIEIFGNTVTVNGVVIIHDGTRSLHHVAVHAAAERVAKVLGRPVRARAIDAEGRATLIVHPDGHASDVELVEADETDEADEPAAAPTAAALAPVAAAPVVAADADPAPPAGPSASPPGRPMDTILATAPTSTPPPTSGAPTGWPSRVVRMVAVAAALVAVIGMGVLLLTNDSEEPGSRRPSTDSTTDPSLAAAGADETPSQTTTTGSTDTVVPVVTVTPVGGVTALRLTITTDIVPATAKIAVTGAGDAKVVKRTVSLEATSTDVDLGDIAPGTASWRVTVSGAPVQKGEVVVAPPYVAPTPTPTPTPTATPTAAPVPVVPVTPVVPPAAPQATKAPSTTPSKAPSKAPSKSSGGGSTFSNKPKDTFKDKGQKGTTKIPSGPVDPDGRVLALR